MFEALERHRFRVDRRRMMWRLLQVSHENFSVLPLSVLKAIRNRLDYLVFVEGCDEYRAVYNKFFVDGHCDEKPAGQSNIFASRNSSSGEV